MAKYQKYAEYKDSGIEWLGQVPTHWDIKRIKETAQIINGYPFDSGKFDPVNGTPLVRIRDINSNETQIFFNGFVPKEALIFNSDILIGMDGDFNVCEWKGGDAALNQRVCCLRSNDKYLTKFLAYLLPARMKIINDLTYFTTVKHLSSTDVLKTVYAIPNKIEYVNIVKFLDHETTKIDHLIEKQQQLIELLKEKRQAVISHAVTKGLDPNVPMKDSGVEWLGEVPEHWDIVKLSQIAVAFNGDRGANYPSGNDFVDEGIYFISANEVINAKVITETASRITQKKYDELGGLKIKKGDIIYCLRGAGVGKNGICDFDEGTVSSSLMGIRSIKLDPDYLVLLLNSSAELQQRSVLVNGSVSPNLSAENVIGYKFAIPAVDEQIEIKKSIELRVNKIEILLSNAEQAIQLMQERRTALISAAVTGKIDVRNWQAPNATEQEMEVST